MKAGKSASIEATVVIENRKKRKKLGVQKRYLSSDNSVAMVAENGKVTAMKKGSCYVYVIAENGVYKRIKIKVK